jgi:hypothetical protein
LRANAEFDESFLLYFFLLAQCLEIIRGTSDAIEDQDYTSPDPYILDKETDPRFDERNTTPTPRMLTVPP